MDINEELIDNNNATSKWLIASITINFMLDIAQLSIYIACKEDSKLEDGNQVCRKNFKIGFLTLNEAQFTVSCLLLLYYTLIAIAYVWLAFRIRGLFKQVSPETYGKRKWLMVFLFVFYETFLILEILCYLFMIVYNIKTIDWRI